MDSPRRAKTQGLNTCDRATHHLHWPRSGRVFARREGTAAGFAGDRVSWECEAPEHAHPRGMGARRIAMRTVRLVLAETAAALALILGSHGASAQPDLEPMIFFVAKGERNACGPGCSEWIAAEGMFEGPKVEQRFRDLLATLKGRNLPIVFNSLGGVIGEALVLGRILRERRMAASVGKSYPGRIRSFVQHPSARLGCAGDRIGLRSPAHQIIACRGVAKMRGRGIDVSHGAPRSPAGRRGVAPPWRDHPESASGRW